MSSNDWFKPPPADAGRNPAARLENAACRKALTLAGVPAARVAQQAGLGATHAAHLTFAALRAFADFPCAPHVTAENPDEVGKILTQFRKTRLYVAWLGFEEDVPDVTPGTRAMIFKGPTWGVSVLYEAPNSEFHRFVTDPDDRPYVVCGRPDRELRIQPYVGWLHGVGWLDQHTSPPDSGPDLDF